MSLAPSPPNLASRDGHGAVVLLLIERVAGIHQAKYVGITPLSIATKKGNIAFLTLLLGRGARVNRASVSWLDSYHAASYSGNADVLELLLASWRFNLLRHDREREARIRCGA